MTLRHRQSLGVQRVVIRGGIIFALLMTVMAAATTPRGVSAASTVPSIDPNSVVPTDFRDNKSWSQEGGWHWVTVSYDGTQRFTGPNYDYSLGKPLPVATYVATMVRSLTPTDSCADCVKISDSQEGPPVVMGGPSNPALQSAYAHLDNGPRGVIDSANPAVKRWTSGTWFLNYSPITRTFFSWTWIPDDGGFQGAKTTAELSTSVVPSLAALGQVNFAESVAPGSRVFPIAGGYQISQGFGCVPLNTGYASPSFCPADRPSFHDGVDFAAPLGTPILAVASGKVTFAGTDTSTSSGNSMIVIDLDGSNAGYETVYMHWEKSFVKAGDHVSAGQVIADVGSVGYSTGPHLHFSVRVVSTNQTVDPLSWLAGSIQFVTSNSATEPAYASVMQWQSLIQQSAKAHNVPAGLIAAIMAVESGGSPGAVSPAGALGLMQMMPSQLTRLGVPQAKWTDPASNIDAAARYLAETLGNGGTFQDAVARYFGSGCDVLGTCTQDYVNRVLTLYVFFANWIETGTAPSLTNPAPVAMSQSPTFSAPMTAQPTTPGTPNSAASQSPSNDSPSTPAAATPPETPESSPEPIPTPATPTPADQSVTPTTTPEPTVTPAATPEVTPTATPIATTAPAATATVAPEVTATSTPEPTTTPTPSSTSTGSSTTPQPTPNASFDTGSGATPAPRPRPIIGPKLSELLPIGSGAGATQETPTEVPTSTPTPASDSSPAGTPTP